MSYLLTVPEAERDLVVSCLRAAADQRTRVARVAAGGVAADKADGKEIRASAIKVALVLADANTLASLADDLAAATMADPAGVISAEQVDAALASVVADAAPPAQPPSVDPPLDVAIKVVLAAAAQTPTANLEDPLTGANLEDMVGPTETVTI